ncbi:MAG: VanZ family protein [Candidatus Marinimicrobia bacterium]|nr:VanZ family protein [Candidatus Neomarinimicrobiota bacterium]
MNIRNYRILFILYMGIILGLSSIPGNSFPGFKILTYDKVIHFFEYFVFGFLAMKSFRSLTLRRVTTIILFGLAFSIFDEIWQSFVPGRSPSPYDAIADLLGIISGVILVKYRAFFHA